MPVADLIADIKAKKLKAVQDRLKKEKPDLKHTEGGAFYYPLHAAVRANSPAIVDALLAAAASVAVLDSNGETALHWVPQHNNKESAQIAEALLKKKAKPDALSATKLTPLHVAAEKGATAVIPVLAKAPEARDSTAPGFTPLHAAARAGKMDAVEALVMAGASLKVQDSAGLTPLMMLLSLGRSTDALALLKARGAADAGVNDADPVTGRTPLLATLAAEPPQHELLQALLAAGAGADVTCAKEPKDSPLMSAVRAGDVAAAKLLLSASKKAAAKNAAGESALSLALSGGSEELVDAILAVVGPELGPEGVALTKGCVEKKQDAMAAKLLRCLKPSQVSALQLDFKSLLASGMPALALVLAGPADGSADGDATAHADPSTGDTPLHTVAATGCSYDTVVQLVKLGVPVDAANKEGDTALHVAARVGNVEVCRALCDAGADPLKRNNKNRTPRSQVKLPEATKDFLLDAEEAAKARKEMKRATVWDDKIKATQTESAFGLRVV